MVDFSWSESSCSLWCFNAVGSRQKGRLTKATCCNYSEGFFGDLCVAHCDVILEKKVVKQKVRICLQSFYAQMLIYLYNMTAVTFFSQLW